MNSPQRDPQSPLTGLEYLTAALSAPDQVVRARKTWEALQAVESPGVRNITYGVLPSLSARADLPREDADRLHRYRSNTAIDVFRAFQRGLMASTFTLAALAKGTPSPVHGTERATLTAAVRRPLIAAGYEVDEATARKATYAVADALRAALTGPAIPVRQPARLGAIPVETGPVADHDEVHWLTGEPLHPPRACAETLAALAAVTSAVSSAEAVVAA